MNRLLIALLAAGAAAPALAQHSGHSPQPPAQPAPDPHAGHHMPAEPPAADPHAGHAAPAEAQPAEDPHAGHSMPPPADPHAGHGMTGHAPAPPATPVGPPPPAAFAGPEHAADTVFGTQAMRPAQRQLIREHGGMLTSRLLLDRFEIGIAGDEEGYAWDGDFFYGGALDKLWLKSEGEGAFGRSLDHGEVQALWSHAIGPFFDLQTGLRYDFAPDPERGHLVLGAQGTAPYWFEIDAAAFLSDKGDVTARLETEYDLRISQRLILQPRIELDVAFQDVPELRIGSGLIAGEAGLRLRYEIVPELAPYVGLQYERAFGRTADFRQADGENKGSLALLAGIRFWF